MEIPKPMCIPLDERIFNKRKMWAKQAELKKGKLINQLYSMLNVLKVQQVFCSNLTKIIPKKFYLEITNPQ